MSSVNKDRKRALTAFEAILKDATPEQITAIANLVETLLVEGGDSPASPAEEDSPSSPVKSKKKGGKKDASPEEDSPSSPDEDSSPAEDDSPSSPEEDSSPAEDDSPAESPSPVKGKKKGGKKDASPEEDSPDEEDSPSSPDEESSPEEDDSPAESPSPVKKKPKKDKEVEAESDTPDYKKMDEKKLYKHALTLSEDEDFVKAVKAVKTNKPKLIKLLKAFDEQVAEYAGMSLSKLEKIRDKQKLTVSYGRGRSSDEKKVAILSKALAVAAVTA